MAVIVMACEGWFHFVSYRDYLNDRDRENASIMCESLGLAGRRYLLQGHYSALQGLVNDQVCGRGVSYVEFLDTRGRVIASSLPAMDRPARGFLKDLPVSVSCTKRIGADLIVARPVTAEPMVDRSGAILGAVRLVTDTKPTAASLAAVQRRVGVIAAAIMICAMPLAYLMVWRLIVLPVRRLVQATRRLAGGDLSARARIAGNDEIAEMGTAFNAMADEVAHARNQLVRANTDLELKVVERTDELQRANRRLQEEISEKEDFLRAVSHDLNAPLRNIAGMATLAMMKWRDELPEDVVARLQRIQANVDVESELIAELLELSRVRTRPHKRALVDMEELLTGLGESFEYDLKARGMSLHVHGPMPQLYLPKNQIRQVFQNLIDNAIKYMHRTSDGRIDIRYSFADRMHRFSVTDNGPGISRGDQERVYQVFRRCENAVTSKASGKGVGLALVRTIVSHCDGRTWVRSEVGQGATFHVALPPGCNDVVSAGPAEDTQRDEQGQPTAAPSRRRSRLWRRTSAARRKVGNSGTRK